MSAVANALNCPQAPSTIARFRPEVDNDPSVMMYACLVENKILLVDEQSRVLPQKSLLSRN